MTSFHVFCNVPLPHQGVLMPIVGFVGLVGNLLSVAVLSGQVRLFYFSQKIFFWQEMTNSFNNLLITLTIFDTTFIAFMLFDYTIIRGKVSSN